ncbi:MAG: cation:dicarboxylase symporter family transporter, partial [Bacteroidota bacterium]
MNFKKNKLILFILLSMIVGLLTGYVINRSITNNKFKYETNLAAYSQSTKNAIVKAELKYEEVKYSEQKRQVASNFSILSDIFLHLIKMIIAPLVLSVLVLGVAKVGDFKSVGRIGLKTLIYFTCATLIALALGLVLVNFFEPGKVMHLSIPEAGVESGIKTNTQTSKNFIDHVIPESLMKSMAANDILPIVVFALFFGIAASSLGEHGKLMIKAFESLSHIMFKVTNYVMNFAPLGVFGAISAVVIQQGFEVLTGYLYLIACFFGGLLFFVFGVLFIVCLIFKINYVRLI